MFYLEVNGICQTGMMSQQKAIAAAAKGHAERPDAIVVLMKEDRKTGKSQPVSRLYN